MREYYIKTKNGNYLVDASPTLVITRGRLDKQTSPYRTRKEAIRNIIRLNKKSYMKKYIPLSVYYRNTKK